MGPTIDSSLTLLVGVLACVIALALYLWLALALAAMFRKMGEDAWKGWVPFLNQATVLKWGGFSPWLILLLLVPGPGTIIVTVLLIISAHRINPGFGYSTGMTVLAALLFVVWASILGFGPAPWRGSRPTVAPAAFTTPPRPPLPAPPVPTSGAPGAAAAFVAAPAGSTSTPAHAATSAAPEPFRPVPLSAPGSAAVSAASDATPSAPPSAGGWAPPPVVPRAAVDEPDIASWPSEIDDVSAVSPSPFPPSSAAPSPGSRPAPVAPPAPVDDGLISFVPGRRSAVPPTPEPRPAAAVTPPPAPVTRMPASTPPDYSDPAAHTDTSDADAFPELSGEVSAVVGSPVAGSPMSARSSVSAQQRVAQPAGETDAEAESDADDVDQTVMVRRKKVTWQLIPASGEPIALSAEVVILGRRPSADGAFPRAQLVPVPDQARTVSKTHARLELRGERWLITDLGSTNGVLLHTLMGEEIEIEPGTELDAGERFYLGDEEFRLQHD